MNAHPADSRTPIVKARLVGVDLPQTKDAGDGKNQLFSDIGSLIPPYDPDSCLYWAINSQSIVPNVDAMATNVDGFGYRFDPAIRLRDKDAAQRVADAILARRFSKGNEDPQDPTDEEVNEEMDRLRRRSRVELAKIKSFFRHAAYDGSFIEFRTQVRFDIEETGNGYAEVLRNEFGEIVKFKYAAAHLTRLMPVEDAWVDVVEREFFSDVEFEEVKTPRRMRKIVQFDEVTRSVTYFKQFNDPRIMSPVTGRYYASVKEMNAEEPAVSRPATEMIHFKSHYHWAGSPYGIPTWVGATYEVMGDNAAAEVNYLLFDNKSIPPLAIFVSGGRLAEGVDDMITKYIKTEIKGRENWNKILLIEAESDGKSGTAPRIEIVKLSKEVTKDALFLEYSAQAKQTIGSQFRIPRILRGDTEGFNRATAEAALDMVEDQVFAPRRERFDYFINNEILPQIGVRFWRFRSLTPSSRDPDRLSKNMDVLSRAGAIVPRDMREIAADVFNREFDPIPEAWMDIPISLTLAGIQTGHDAERRSAQAGPDDDLDAKATDLLGIQQRLRDKAMAAAARRAEMARAHAVEEVIEVPKALFEQWVQQGKE